MGGAPVASPTVPKDLQEGIKLLCLVPATVNRNENEDGRASFLGGSYRRAWTRVVQEGRGGMGHTQLKTGVQGGHVEHREETEVKVVQKEESGGRQKKKKKARGKKRKKKIFGPSTSHENRPPSPTKKTLRVYLRTTCITSGKGQYGHKRSTCVLYGNIVSTGVCANNCFWVVQNGSAVVPWHYRAREGNGGIKGRRTRPGNSARTPRTSLGPSACSASRVWC